MQPTEDDDQTEISKSQRKRDMHELKRLGMELLEFSDDALRELLLPYRGGSCPVIVNLHHAAGSGLMTLGQEWCVAPEEALLEDLRTRFGSASVALQY